MAKSTTSKILDVWSMVSGLDKKGKQIIRDKLNAELTEPKSTIREPENIVKKEGV